MPSPFTYRNKVKQEKNVFGHTVQDAIFGLFDEAEGESIEIKADRRASQTGNWFVEYRDNQGEPSGIEITKAKYWLFITAGACLFIPTVRLKEYLASLTKQERVRARAPGVEGSTGYKVQISVMAAWMWENRGLKDSDTEKPWMKLSKKAGQAMLYWWQFEEKT